MDGQLNSTSIASLFNSEHIEDSPFLDVIINFHRNKNCVECEKKFDLLILLGNLMCLHDVFTERHCASVCRVTYNIAGLLDIPLQEKRRIAVSGYLHDLGKIAIPGKILNKKDPLNWIEKEKIRKHSYYTTILLNNFRIPKDIISWASNHHERLDGSGYPLGLKSHEIDIPSRIIAIADVICALKEERPYRKGLAIKEIIKVLNSDSEKKTLDKDIINEVRKKLKIIITQV